MCIHSLVEKFLIGIQDRSSDSNCMRGWYKRSAHILFSGVAPINIILYLRKEADMGQTVKFKCEYCEADHERKKADYDRAKNHYCCHSCWAKAADSTVRTECTYCKKELVLKRNDIRRRTRVFCSHYCVGKFFANERGHKPKANKALLCLRCNKLLTNYQTRYCSRECQCKYEEERTIREWKSGKITGVTGDGFVVEAIRRYIVEKYGNKCAKCGWCETNTYTQKSPLQIHHINGDSNRADEENLILLCPNCHSLTEKFGGRNRGNGRDSRKIWRAKVKEKLASMV